MRTKVEAFRNVDKKRFEAREYNIYFGISLGNRWFTKEHIKQYIIWALEHTKDTVAVQIADRLHAINYEVRNGLNKEAALQKALREGDKMIKVVREIIKELPSKQQEKIEIVQWEIIEKDESILKIKEIIYKEFVSNQEFKKIILKIVKSFIAKDSKNFTEKQINHLARYVLEELPEIINGFHHKGIHYNLWIYPADSLLCKLAEDIQKKKAFSHLHEQVQIGNNGFIALNLS